MTKRNYREASRGGAVVEVALLAPWIFFLFVGVLDFGFYSYAAICVQNAARIAVLTNSYSSVTTSDTAGACDSAISELGALPNMRSVTVCAPGTVSDSQPVSVSATSIVSGPDGAAAASVTVTYLSIPMIPIPGALTGQVTITRGAIAPVINKVPVS